MKEEVKDFEFYKKFYDENRVRILQYESLRVNFQELKIKTLGDKYYVDAYDVYDSDKEICKAIEKKCNRGFWDRIFDKIYNYFYK